MSIVVSVNHVLGYVDRCHANFTDSQETAVFQMRSSVGWKTDSEESVIYLKRGYVGCKQSSTLLFRNRV